MMPPRKVPVTQEFKDEIVRVHNELEDKLRIRCRRYISEYKAAWARIHEPPKPGWVVPNELQNPGLDDAEDVFVLGQYPAMEATA